MAEELLAERELSGYPGIRVALHVDLTKDIARVTVTDSHGVTTFNDPDAYLHPFARGYVAPKGEFSDGA
jgi:hypothetical protein